MYEFLNQTIMNEGNSGSSIYQLLGDELEVEHPVCVSKFESYRLDVLRPFLIIGER